MKDNFILLFRNRNIIKGIWCSSTEDWQKLRGVVPSFSKRIIAFRSRLGGFYSIEQVGETYSLPDSIFQKIELNQATENKLKSHPYISWNQTKLIISYRKMHGYFKGVNELLQIGALKKY